jgi:REP element-mobilizing transposase RayT
MPDLRAQCKAIQFLQWRQFLRWTGPVPSVKWQTFGHCLWLDGHFIWPVAANADEPVQLWGAPG